MANIISPAPVGVVKQVQFSVLGPDEIREMSVCEIKYAEMVENGRPKYHSLHDPRLGPLEPGQKCETCNSDYNTCPGHFGHIELARPMFHMGFFSTVISVLKCICYHCGRLLVSKNDTEFKKAQQYKKPQLRLRKMVQICQGKKKCDQSVRSRAEGFGGPQDGANGNGLNLPGTSGLSNGNDADGDNSLHEGCGRSQPRYVRQALDLKIIFEDSDDTQEVDHKLHNVDLVYIYELLQKISDEDCRCLGFNPKYTRPHFLMLKVLPVPPPCIRPSILMDATTRAEDDLTYALKNIVRSNNDLAQRIERGQTPTEIQTAETSLQYYITTYMDNTLPSVGSQQQKSGKPIKSISQRLKGKEGRIRGNLMGKRTDFSGRSVITPDPNISVDEVGVPRSIALTLTTPERVTPHNLEKLYRLVMNGPDVHPGARYVIRPDGSRLDLSVADPSKIHLKEGYIVERHMDNGDWVLFNRQPSLHKMSMMGHKVKVLPYSSFRLNLSCTTPYNADFDGDEMNLHLPQSIEAKTELREIMQIPKQIVTPASHKNVVGVVQDSLLAMYLFTSRDTFLERDLAMNCLMWLTHFDGVMPRPAILKPRPLWTGKQIISLILPPISLKAVSYGHPDSEKRNSGMSVKDTQVVIERGQLLSGRLCGKTLKQSHGSIIHVTWKDYGPEAAKQVLNQIQRVTNYWLIQHGFTVGISDTIADEKTFERVSDVIYKLKAEVSEYFQQRMAGEMKSEPGMTLEETFEANVNKSLNNCTDVAGKIAQEALSPYNNLKTMVAAGSKGNLLNVSQITACVGQQNVEGKRIPYGFRNRTLPHFTQSDFGPESRGFVQNSYLKGLTPQEFFFHSMGGREGIIDTAVKTSETGYIQRRLIKAMEDLYVAYDGTVRNSVGEIIQFYYGEDGMAGEQLEHNKFPSMNSSNEQFTKDYLIDLDEEINLYAISNDYDRMGAMYGSSESSSSSSSAIMLRYSDSSSSSSLNNNNNNNKVNVKDDGSNLSMHLEGDDYNEDGGVDIYALAAKANIHQNQQRKSSSLLLIDEKDPQLTSEASENIDNNNNKKEDEEDEESDETDESETDSEEDEAEHPELVDLFGASKDIPDKKKEEESLTGIDGNIDVIDADNINQANGEESKNGVRKSSVFMCSSLYSDKNVVIKPKHPHHRVLPCNLNKQQGKNNDYSNNSKIYNKYGQQILPMFLTKKAIDSLIHDEDAREILQKEYEQLLADRIQLRKMFPPGEDSWPQPVMLDRIIDRAKSRFCISPLRPTSLSPAKAVKMVQGMLKKVNMIFSMGNVNDSEDSTMLFNILCRSTLASRLVTEKHRLSRQALSWVLDEIEHKFTKSIVQPGEMVGIVAAESIGEPATQMTLNTFHFAGVSAKNVTLGIPRLKELINVTKKTKTPGLVVYLDEAHKESKDKAREVLAELEYTTLYNVTASSEIIYDPDDYHTVVPEDEHVIELFHEIPDLDPADVDPNKLSTWVLRLILEPDVMYEKNVQMMEIRDKITELFNNEVLCISSDDNDTNLVVRVRIRLKNEGKYGMDDEEGKKKKEGLNGEFAQSDGGETSEINSSLFESIESLMLKSIKLRGVEDITKVFLRETSAPSYGKDGALSKETKEWQLETEGCNLLEVMCQDNVDPWRTTSNNIVEVFQIFGIEAVRQALFTEVKKILSFDQSYTNFRHLSMLIDLMTTRGALTSISRHGLGSMDTGPLMRCTYEESTKILLSAAAFSEKDNLHGVSQAVILGQPAPAGTGLVTLVLDKSKLTNVTKRDSGYDRQVHEQVREDAIRNRELSLSQGLNTDLRSYKSGVGGLEEYQFRPFSPRFVSGFASFSPSSVVHGPETGSSGQGMSGAGGISPLHSLASPNSPFAGTSPLYSPSSYDQTSLYSPSSPNNQTSPLYSPGNALSGTSPLYSPSSPAQGSSPLYSPSSPSYTPSSPRYSPSSPAYSPSSPAYSPSSPAYSPSSHAYSPSSPAYSPSSPAYSPSSPAYSPSSPAYSPSSPAYSPSSPAYSPSSPAYSPSSPAYSPSSPAYSPSSPEYSPSSPEYSPSSPAYSPSSPAYSPSSPAYSPSSPSYSPSSPVYSPSSPSYSSPSNS